MCVGVAPTGSDTAGVIADHEGRDNDLGEREDSNDGVRE